MTIIPPFSCIDYSNPEHIEGAKRERLESEQFSHVVAATKFRSITDLRATRHPHVFEYEQLNSRKLGDVQYSFVEHGYLAYKLDDAITLHANSFEEALELLVDYKPSGNVYIDFKTATYDKRYITIADVRKLNFCRVGICHWIQALPAAVRLSIDVVDDVKQLGVRKLWEHLKSLTHPDYYEQILTTALQDHPEVKRAND